MVISALFDEFCLYLCTAFLQVDLSGYKKQKIETRVFPFIGNPMLGEIFADLCPLAFEAVSGTVR
jgi:hypothetical protein